MRIMVQKRRELLRGLFFLSTVARLLVEACVLTAEIGAVVEEGVG